MGKRIKDQTAIERFTHWENKHRGGTFETRQKKEHESSMKFLGNARNVGKADAYNKARKEMGLSEDAVTTKKYNYLMGNAKTGDKGAYARWKEQNEAIKKRESTRQKVTQGPATPKKLDKNNLWTQRRKEVQPLKTKGEKVDAFVKPIANFLDKTTKPIRESKVGKAVGKVMDKYDQYVASGMKNYASKQLDQSEKDRGKVKTLADLSKLRREQSKPENIKKRLSELKQGYSQAWKGEKRTTGEELRKKMKIKTGSKYLDKAVDSAIEGALDPGTYVGGAVAKGVAKPIGKVVGKTKVGKAVKEIREERAVAKATAKAEKKNAKTVAQQVASTVEAQVKPQVKATNPPKVAEQIVNNVKAKVGEKVESVAKTVKQKAQVPQKTSIQEVIKAMQQEGFKTAKKSPKIAQKKFDAVDKMIEGARHDNQFEQLVKGYEENARTPHTEADLETVAKQIASDRQDVRIANRESEKYLQRYADLRDYVTKKAQGKEITDADIRQGWEEIRDKKREDFDVEGLVERAYNKDATRGKPTTQYTREANPESPTDARIREIVSDLNKPYETQHMLVRNDTSAPQKLIGESPEGVANRSLDAIMQRVQANRGKQAKAIVKGEKFEPTRPQGDLGQLAISPKRERVQAENISAAPQLALREGAQLDPRTAPLSRVDAPEVKPVTEDVDAKQHFRDQLVEPQKVEEPTKTKVKKTLHSIYKQMVDKKATLGLVDRDAGRNKFTSKSALAKAHLESGTGGKIEQELLAGFYDKNGKKFGDSYQDTFKGLKNADETMAYMSAKRVQDYENRKGGLVKDENGEPVLDADGNPTYYRDPLTAIDSNGYDQMALSEKAVRDFEAEQPHLKEEAKKVETLMDNQMSILEDGGFYNKDQIAEMKEDNPNYLPFNRDRSDIPESYFKNSGSGSSGRPIYARTGSTRKILNPKNTILKRTVAFNNMAARNKTNVELLNNAMELPEDNQWVRVVGMDEDYLYKGKQKIDGKEVEQDMMSHIDDLAQGSDEDFVSGMDNLFSAKEGNTNIQYAYKDGNRYHLQIMNPELAESMSTKASGLDKLVVKALTVPTDMVRWGVTISPDFAVRNWARDQLTTAITSPVGYKPVIDSVIGASKIIRNSLATSDKKLLQKMGKESPLLNAYIRNGGSMDVFKQLGDVDVPHEYRELMKDKGIKQQIKDILDQPTLLLKAKESGKVAGTPIKKVFEMLKTASEFSEQSTRIGHMNRAMKYGEKQYKKNMKLVEQGKMSLEDAEKQMIDMEDATYISKAALDFTRSGDVGRVLNRYSTFFNPWVQGLDVMARAAKDRPLRTIGAVTSGITLPSVALAMLNHDEQWYQDIPQEDRDMNWYIKSEGMEHPLKIPKPFEMGVLFGSLPERMVNKYMNGDKEAYDGFGKSLMESLTPSVIPQLIKPILEAVSNYDFFQQRNIESMSDEYKDVPDRKNVYSSQVAIKTSEILSRMNPDNKYSPKKIDHLIRGYGGTMTDQINKQVVDRGLRAISKDIPERPSGGIEDVPFAGAFIQKNMEGNNKPTNDFYDLVDRLQKASKKAPEGEYKEEAQRLDANRDMRQINDKQSEKRTIQEDLKKSGEQKAKEIKKLNKEITDIARKGLEKYKNSKQN